MDTETLGLNSFPKVADGKGLLTQAVWIRFCSFFFLMFTPPTYGRSQGQGANPSRGCDRPPLQQRWIP